MLPLFAAAVAAVASPSPLPSASSIPQIVRVVTSDRSEEAISKSTRVTYVVTKQQIEKYGYRTIGDTLTKVPGVELETYGAIGSNQSYAIRGSNSSQVLVLVDGMPVWQVTPATVRAWLPTQRRRWRTVELLIEGLPDDGRPIEYYRRPEDVADLWHRAGA